MDAKIIERILEDPESINSDQVKELMKELRAQLEALNEMGISKEVNGYNTKYTELIKLARELNDIFYREQ